MTLAPGVLDGETAAADLTPQDADIQDLRAIYERLYPTQHLHYVLRQGVHDHAPMVEVRERRADLRHHDLGPEFLGVIERPGLEGDKREVTIIAALPRPARPDALAPADAPWAPVRRLHWLFRAAPMAYETLRYGAEMARKHRFERRDRREQLPFGLASRAVRPLPATDKRPAVLIGLHWLETGGAERLAIDSVTWAHRAGLRVFVVASVPSPQRLASRLPQHPDVSFIRLDRHLPHELWTRYLTQLALDENIRLVHIHHCIPLYEALPTLRARVPDLRVIDSTHIVEYPNGGFPWISGTWSRFIDRHHVISGALRDYLRVFAIPDDKVLLGRMLDRDGVVPRPVRFRAGQSSLHVAFVGRLTYQKRPVVLVLIIRALVAWARRRRVKLRVSLVGDGPFSGALEGLLKRYGLQDKVTLLPPQSDVPALLHEADVLLLPSNNEGLALVCYEAVAQGCIPIATRVGSQYELLPDELLVPLAPHRTVRGMVAAIDRLWRDPDFVPRMAKDLTARRTALAADPTAEQILMPLYRQIATGQEMP